MRATFSSAVMVRTDLPAARSCWIWAAVTGGTAARPSTTPAAFLQARAALVFSEILIRP